MTTAFADRLILRVRELGHPLCAGIDPILDQIPAPFRVGAMAPGDPATADAVEQFCLAYLDRVADRVAILKPQSAFFEALGWRGVKVLSGLLAEARSRGLLVLLDAKRGDIGSTAAGYAAAYLEADAPLRADALTINPYLGTDTVEPHVSAAAPSGSGLFVLTRTSNPGGRDYQELEAAGRPVFEHVAGSLAPLAKRLVGPETGYSGLGLVVGATYADESRRLRELRPDALFLVPGYGAQGGTGEAAVAGFVRGPTGRLEGGVVNSARGLHFPASSGDDAASWERAVDGALDRAISELGEATA
ncbi:MAG: orotidine-5'-phosphate decarboxylase [Myxococcota bacterium]